MSTHPAANPLTRKDLEAYFRNGCKKPDNLQVGVEWEKIGVYRESLKAIRYGGRRGVASIFHKMMRRYGWAPVKQGTHIIALRKGNSSITLEPGGQIELSGEKSAHLEENAAELRKHLEEIKQISDSMGIVWLGIGTQPVSHHPQIEWVPKERYKIMRQALKAGGHLTYAMMKETASIQVSLDYTSEKDAAKKLRLAFALSPVFSAMYANSPLSGGRLSGFLTRRCQIWRHTAPERTGILEAVFKKTFDFAAYTDYALNVPMLFIIRSGRWIPTPKITFLEFLKNGFKGLRACQEDWKNHLTTIFTEARLKQYVEIRSIDCQKTLLGLSAPALLKGLFYDASAQKNAWALVADLSQSERQKLFQTVPRLGLHTPFKSGTLWDLSTRLIELSEEGLVRIQKREGRIKDESAYLAPLKELLIRRRKMPAEILIECFNHSGASKAIHGRIVNCAAI